MKSLNTLWRAIEKGLVNAGRTRARHELLSRGDQFLAETGFSKALLRQGNDAWPWRIDGQEPVPATGAMAPPAGLRVSASAVQPFARQRSTDEYARSVAELRAFSDAELNDLGISRSGIEDAVRFGRPGLDTTPADPEQSKAA